MAVLRRIKSNLKEVIKKKKKTTSKKTVKAVKNRRKVSGQVKHIAKVIASKKSSNDTGAAVVALNKDLMGSQEIAVERAKFSYPGRVKAARAIPQELPGNYDKDMMVLYVRDPWWLHTYWEVARKTLENLKNQLKEMFNSARRALRVYDVTRIDFNGKNAHSYFDIEINSDANNWYIGIGCAGRSWCVDYGLKMPSGEFITILRSNIVHTPSDGPSHITDEEWMIPEEMFGRLYGMGFGFGQSSPVGKAWQERMRQALFSGVLSSGASPVKQKAKKRKFWFVLDCELIVYGATEPDASVSVQGKPIKLRQDGTFTLRFALPDGKQVIPVKAVSNDKVEEHTITPLVMRETRREKKYR